MRWILVPVILACAMSALAGDIVIGACSECGNETGEFFVGRGMTPGYIADVYRDPGTGGFHLVGFDIVLITAEEIAVNINNSHREIGEMTVEEIAVNINNSHREIDMEAAEEIAVTVTNNHRETGMVTAEEIAVTINNSHRVVEALYEAWSSPEVLGALIVDGRIPMGVELGGEATGEPTAWELINVNGNSLCSACGGETIQFELVGSWD